MPIMPFLPVLATSTTATPPPRLESVYIGTYASNQSAHGIFRCFLNSTSGELSPAQLVGQAENPSYLAVHPNRQFIYAVDEFTSGDLLAFKIEKEGILTFIGKSTGAGSGPCHVSLNKLGSYALVSAYGGGSLACFPIEAKGAVRPLSGFFQNQGSGPYASRQEGPHLHSAYFERGLIYACDLGTDEILRFRLGQEKATLEPCKPSIKMPPGSGPRHLAFHPNGKWVYVNHEMGNAVSLLLRSSDGNLQLEQTVPTLPEGIDHHGKTTAAIVLHPNGKWLYVSNRGHESIAIYQLGKDGCLKLLEIVPTGVREPRGMAIDPSGKWMVVGGQKSNDLVTMKIDAKTGKLSSPVGRASVGAPVCITFLP